MDELPPYFSLDLARLVLGYLEEEECTSAYVEFIKCSPHLDAFRTNRNNSACSFKTLKDIFGEYCAFKTYTRNCNVPTLRSLLLQCKTLVDTAQLLIAHVDHKKLQNQADSQPRNSGQFAVPSHPPKRRECEVCNVIGHTERCECRGRQPIQPNLFATPFKNAPQEGAAFTNLPLETLVETTQLADLPGTSATAKRINASENPSQQPTTHKADLLNQSDQRLHRAELNATTDTEQAALCEQSELAGKEKAPPYVAPQSLNISVKTTDLMNCSENLNDILNIVSRTHGTGNACTNQATLGVDKSSSSAADSNRRTSSVEGSFHAFTSGVASDDSKCATFKAMPDSSTPESNTSQAVRSRKSYHQDSANIGQSPSVTLMNTLVNTEPRHELSQAVPLSHEHYSVETERSSDSSVSSEFQTGNKHTNKSNRLNQKPVCSSSTKGFESKIKILSDNVVKTTVDSGKLVINKKGTATTLRLLPGKPPGQNTFSSFPPSNAIIHINGMTVFQNKEQLKTYTKEQIMAMPTVIVSESPAGQRSSTSTTNVTSTTANTTASPAVQVDSGYRSLGPITVSVGSTSDQVSSDTVRQFEFNKEVAKETASMEKVSTPNKPLLLKKASSTPRRNSSSHVRALDFATPRRILHVMEQGQTTELVSVETTTVAESSSIQQPTPLVPGVDVTEVPPQEHKQVVKIITGGWDADLRALLPCSDTEPVKKKATMKKKSSKPKDCKNSKQKTKSKDKSKKKSEIIKKKKARKVPEEIEDEAPSRSNVLKPTINLIKDWREEPKKPSIKMNDNFVEISIPERSTPETDVRPSTSNPPSANHNLSDFFLLQTPLKMMIANIQMETPQSIDPAILGEPISDIKIDTIPTPNFLNTPNFLLSGGKGMAGTPSSYSSRPTDYSSGGSYYRPDELEYAPPPDLQPPPPPDLQPPPPPTSPPPNCTAGKLEPTKTPKHKDHISTTSRPSRPRRQCTLKVSYYDAPTAKSKSLDKSDSTRSCSPSVSANYLTESSQQSDSSKTTIDGDEGCKEQYQNKNIETKEDMLAQLEQKRKRTVDLLKKKTPVKNSRKGGAGSSFPKVKMSKKKPLPARRPKTVAELRQTIGPRKMPNSSKKKIHKRSRSKDSSECLTPLSSTPMPARSRRKSSTPRKVNKFIAHNLDDSASVETVVTQKPEADMMEEEFPPLRISSDDGSQDARCRRVINYEEPDTDDISQIKAYIEKSSQASEPTVQELVQRGFDLETAKSIERDLQDTPRHDSHELSAHRSDNEEMGKIILDLRQEVSTSSKVTVTIENEIPTKAIESPPPQSASQPAGQEMHSISSQANVTSTSISQGNSLKNCSDIILDGDIFMVRETYNEESDNYFTCQYDEEQPREECVSDGLDEHFAFDIHVEDVNIKICFNKFETLYDLPPREMEETIENVRNQLLQSSDSEDVHELDDVEIVNAVESISNINPLYTPMKADHSHSLHKRQCLDIFDSTLNSLDTPMKHDTHTKSVGALSPRIDEDDARESWEHASSTKRLRQSGSPVQESISKKSRPDPQIQLLKNIDIESLLTKLHGEEDVKGTS